MPDGGDEAQRYAQTLVKIHKEERMICNVVYPKRTAKVGLNLFGGFMIFFLEHRFKLNIGIINVSLTNIYSLSFALSGT